MSILNRLREKEKKDGKRNKEECKVGKKRIGNILQSIALYIWIELKKREKVASVEVEPKREEGEWEGEEGPSFFFSPNAPRYLEFVHFKLTFKIEWIKRGWA